MITTKRFTRQIAVFIAVVFLAWPTTSNADQREAQAKVQHEALMPEKHTAILQRYCYECHDSGSEEAGVNLEAIPLKVNDSMEVAALWQKVLNAVNSGEMPPEDHTQMTATDKTAFLEDLTAQMVIARGILSDSGGEIPLRRLNRREYANTIQDLLGVVPDVSSLPNDQIGAGFDTQGGSLFFSSDQLENYLHTARRSLRLSLLSKKTPPSKTVRIEPEESFTSRYQTYLAELQDFYDRAKAWKAQKEKPPSEFGILDAYSVKKKMGAYEKYSPQLKWYLKQPETKTGIISIILVKGGLTRVNLPKMHAGARGRYTVRLRVAHYPHADERFHYVELSSSDGSERKHLAWKRATATLDKPQVLSFEYEHNTGKAVTLSISPRTHQDRADKNLWTLAQRKNGMGTTPGLWIDWVELIGPEPLATNQSTKNRLLPARNNGTSEKEHATNVIRNFATQAFRGRPPQREYIGELVAHYQAERKAGRSVNEAFIEPLAIILASPEFLYMVEEGRTNNRDRLSNTELAVRLSYLLGSSQPDKELMQLAAQNELGDPAILREQVQRLLKDPRHDRFVHDFVHQWLQMDRLGMFQFDGAMFQTFDNAVRESAREEIFQTFDHALKNSLPIGSLLKADFVVINDLLADYYGLPDVVGSEFRSVKVPSDSPRGGLLGTAAVMAMGSDGLRTSPVERGAWVLRHLLHDPPAPAPPNVPQLSRLDGEVFSARDLQKVHQEQPQCAQCHRKIDPIGFGLENFNADGLWREIETVGSGKKNYGQYKNTVKFAIEPSGTLPSGETFENYFEMRDAIANYGADFARGFTEALIAYGMGRPYGFSDQTLADEIMSAAKQDGYSVSSFIHALVQSNTFQTR